MVSFQMKTVLLLLCHFDLAWATGGLQSGLWTREFYYYYFSEDSKTKKDHYRTSKRRNSKDKKSSPVNDALSGTPTAMRRREKVPKISQVKSRGKKEIQKRRNQRKKRERTEGNESKEENGKENEEEEVLTLNDRVFKVAEWD